jgi:hypothetical protein
MTVPRKLMFGVSTPLPKRLFRPFPNYSADRDMDDKRFIDLTDVPWGWKGSFSMWAYIFSLIGTVSAGLIWISDPLYRPAAIAAGVSLSFGVAWHLFARKRGLNETDRFITFERETGLVHWECGYFKKKVLIFPFHEAEACLQRTGRPIVGAGIALPEQRLIVLHANGGGILDTSTLGPDGPLSYWSFLVQYMDRSAPLPDVEPLKQYPNRSKGLGTWEEWKRNPPLDPYLHWKAQWRSLPPEKKRLAQEHGVDAMLNAT